MAICLKKPSKLNRTLSGIQSPLIAVLILGKIRIISKPRKFTSMLLLMASKGSIEFTFFNSQGRAVKA